MLLAPATSMRARDNPVFLAALDQNSGLMWRISADLGPVYEFFFILLTNFIMEQFSCGVFEASNHVWHAG
jgi:hypothetical protein